METGTKQRHCETNRIYETNEINRYLYHFFFKQKNIPSSQHLTVTSPKLTYNWSQNRPQQMQED